MANLHVVGRDIQYWGKCGVCNEASLSGRMEGSGYLRKVAMKAIGLIFLDLAAHNINDVEPDKQLAHMDPRVDTP